MRKWNALLVFAIAIVLATPGAVAGNAAEACCGVDVTNLTVVDAPDPACVGEPVTISGTYVAYSPWGPWTEDYDTGVEITIYDSEANVVGGYSETLGVDQPDPGDLPGTEWSFSYDWLPEADPCGAEYTYEVVAWSETSWGRMEITAVGGTITVIDCTPPVVSCVEATNPAGNNVPGEKANGKGQGVNPDGFYQLIATDDCDVEIFVSGFGPFQSGDIVKITQAPGATPSMKKIGSDKANAVAAHITIPDDPCVTAVDSSGNESQCTDCPVPPPPK